MRPTRAAVLACTGWLALGIAVAFWPALQLPFVGSGLALLALGLADALLLWRREPPRAQRTLPRTMALGEHYEVSLTLTSQRRERVVLHERTPAQVHSEGLPVEVGLEPGIASRITYRLRPLSRGELVFEQPGFACRGVLQLMERELRGGQRESVRVYPSFRRVGNQLAPGEAGRQHGMHVQRRRGTGTEFHQLREFRPGDALRQVDWKSVARRQQLVSREFRSEQNQNVIFLVDCGRRMRAHDGELSLLDQSLHALLSLSHVALRQGDSVGLLTFDEEARWLAPVRGTKAMNTLLASVFDLESTSAPSDFERAVALLSARQQRRALVVLLTNLGDDDVDSLQSSLASLRNKHLVLVASMRDPELAAQRNDPIHDEHDALRALSVLSYLDARQAARAQLSAAGVATLECEPADLPRSLVERYLTIKRSGTL